MEYSFYKYSFYFCFFPSCCKIFFTLMYYLICVSFPWLFPSRTRLLVTEKENVRYSILVFNFESEYVPLRRSLYGLKIAKVGKAQKKKLCTFSLIFLISLQLKLIMSQICPAEISRSFYFPSLRYLRCPYVMFCVGIHCKLNICSIIDDDLLIINQGPFIKSKP